MPSRSNKTEGKGQERGHYSDLGNKWGVGSDLRQRSNKGRDKGQRFLGEKIFRTQKPGNVQCHSRRWPVNGGLPQTGSILSPSNRRRNCDPERLRNFLKIQDSDPGLLILNLKFSLKTSVVQLYIFE